MQVSYNRRLLFVLLLLQAANALVATVGQWVLLGALGAFSTSGGLALISGVGTIALFVLARGALEDWPWSRRTTYAVEALMLLGAVPRVLQGLEAEQAPNIGWLIANVGLPLAVIAALRGGLGWQGLVGALLLSSGLVHFGLAGAHTGGLGFLFVVDSLVLVSIGLLSLRRPRWRGLTGWLLAANLVGYVVVVGSGREVADALGVSTKLVELVALGLTLGPRGAVALVGATFLTGAVTWISTLRTDGVETHHHPQLARAAPTAAEREAAEALVDATRAGVARYDRVAVAVADGYRPTTPPNGRTVHYMNSTYEHDAYALDPSRPEGLVYANTVSGPLLMGAVFTMPKLGQAGPTPGGSIAHWHTHDNVCIGVPVISLAGLATPLGACPPGSFNIATPEMMHIWTIDNPRGPFTDDLDQAFIAKLSKTSRDA